MFDSRHRPELGSAEHDEMEAYRTAYMSIVGGLLWLANMTFPELSYPASQLARFLTNPGMQHYQAETKWPFGHTKFFWVRTKVTHQNLFELKSHKIFRLN